MSVKGAQTWRMHTAKSRSCMVKHMNSSHIWILSCVVKSDFKEENIDCEIDPTKPYVLKL